MTQKLRRDSEKVSEKTCPNSLEVFGVPKKINNQVLTYITLLCILSSRTETMEFNKDLIAASSTPIVLAILAEKDSYGYAIIKRVQELSKGRMEWTDGMLYPVLHRLERLGYVEARWIVAESGRNRKYYRITSKGRTQLAEERKQWQVVDATLKGIWKSLSLMAVSTAHLATTSSTMSSRTPNWGGNFA